VFILQVECYQLEHSPVIYLSWLLRYLKWSLHIIHWTEWNGYDLLVLRIWKEAIESCLLQYAIFRLTALRKVMDTHRRCHSSAVSRLPLTAEVHGRSRASPCICPCKIHGGTCLTSFLFRILQSSASFHWRFVLGHSFIYVWQTLHKWADHISCRKPHRRCTCQWSILSKLLIKT
jgi:hypothetical protein